MSGVIRDIASCMQVHGLAHRLLQGSNRKLRSQLVGLVEHFRLRREVDSETVHCRDDHQMSPHVDDMQRKVLAADVLDRAAVALWVQWVCGKLASP